MIVFRFDVLLVGFLRHRRLECFFLAGFFWGCAADPGSAAGMPSSAKVFSAIVRCRLADGLREYFPGSGISPYRGGKAGCDNPCLLLFQRFVQLGIAVGKVPVPHSVHYCRHNVRGADGDFRLLWVAGIY